MYMLVVDLPGATPLKKIGSPSLRSFSQLQQLMRQLSFLLL